LDVAHPLFVTPEEMARIKDLHLKEFDSFNKVIPCPFFGKDRLCMIHGSKPVDCRLFPFDLLKLDGKHYWIVWKIGCAIAEEVDRYEEYLQDMEERLIPVFAPWLDQYSKFRFEELQSKYRYDVLRELIVKVIPVMETSMVKD
jgi:hypothetical protein